MILTVTGHRPNRLGGYRLPNPVANAVMSKMAESLQNLNPERVLVGMAQGTDQWTAEICCDLRIPFDAIIPVAGFERTWPERAQWAYRALLNRANRTVVLHPGPYSPSLLHQRNHWMVDHSDTLLAVWDGSQDGGTYACIDYAQHHNPPRPAYMLSLPKEIWDMAREDQGRYEERLAQRRHAEWERQRRVVEMEETVRFSQLDQSQSDGMLSFHALVEEENARSLRNKLFLKKIEGQAPPQKTEEKTPEKREYRRFIDVGNEEP